ncbi:nicotinamidase [Aliidongia dinghuensis]|uniref:nicotinamidase n=1 Tax=Aliidongia dinghuensis TaxID=1867774 RepID=A0A8J2YTV1_9PROT|nr:bifunctional nicotinamidase/pyrazinamidase [Aliidongia dinghuensis]GGF17933.1 nicotinamidase [Aliidongia dinghuensis]
MDRIAIDRRADILGLIDIQPTFMPGGELAVPDGDAVVAVANRLLADRFDHAFATQDWHPAGHHSFASAHPGRAPFETIRLAYGDQTLWPDHGVQGSPGAALHPALDQAKIELVVRKGFRPAIDSYSAFFENDRTTATGLAGYLKERGFRRIFFAGLATDFCVAYSAEDAVRAGFAAVVVEDACRGIGMPAEGGGTTIDAARRRLKALGVRFVTTAALG